MQPIFVNFDFGAGGHSKSGFLLWEVEVFSKEWHGWIFPYYLWVLSNKRILLPIMLSAEWFRIFTQILISVYPNTRTCLNDRLEWTDNSINDEIMPIVCNSKTYWYQMWQCLLVLMSFINTSVKVFNNVNKGHEMHRYVSIISGADSAGGGGGGGGHREVPPGSDSKHGYIHTIL